MQTMLLLLAVSAAWFALLAASPGDYFDLQRLDPRVSAATVDKLRAEYGLTKPWWVRYGDWLVSVAHGEMGVSIVYNEPVADLLLPRCANTLLLTLTSTALAWGLALPAGLWAAVRRGGGIDHVWNVAAGLLLAIPELLLGTLLVYWAAGSARWPAGGMRSAQDGGLLDILRHLALPAGVLAAGLFPIVFRHFRNALAEASGLPFVRAARAVGVSPPRIWLHSVLRVAANPMISLLGLSIGGILSSSLLAEVIFGWPGLGPLFVEAVMTKDTYLVLAPVMFSAVALAVGNLLADLLLMWNDPRIRAAG